MKRIDVHLEFLAPDDADPDAFGESVLCAVERSTEFVTDTEGLLRLKPSDT